MKIERINENSIRCTLTRDDLEERQVKLSEIAYGTEKAKMLFHDMMMQASKELGFEANDIPLMIEAIPGAGDSIILNITKVENPDDIDSKFSKLGSMLGEPNKNNSLLERMKKLEGAEDVLDILRHVTEAVKALPEIEEQKSNADDSVAEPSIPLRFFSFSTLDSVIRAATLLNGIYNGSNTLYKDDIAELYLLAMTQTEHTTSDFNRICNMLSEYGCAEPGDGATLAFLEEHCTVVLPQNALQTLGQL